MNKEIKYGVFLKLLNSMGKTFLLLTLLFCIYSCTQLKYLNAFDGHNGSPEIMESRMYHFSGTGEASTEKLAGRNVYYYDRRGRKQEHLIYRTNENQPVSRWKFIYDKSGNLIQVISFNSVNSIDLNINYSYNKYGQQIFREHVSGNKRIITKTEYDINNRKAIQLGITNDSVFHEKSIIFYDDKWRDIEIQSFNQRDKIERRSEKVYDDLGNQVLSRWFDSTNRMYEFHKMDFDTKNNRTRIENYRILDKDTTLLQTTQFEYIYDEKGNIVYEAMISNGHKKLVTRNSYKY